MSEFGYEGYEKSFPFPFAEWRVNTSPAFPSRAIDAVTDPPMVQSVAEKWVYAFPDVPSTIAPCCYEIWIDTDWQRWVSPQDDLKLPVTQRAVGGMTEGADASLAMPERIEGYKPGYRFLVSGIRLPLKVLEAIAGTIEDHVPLVAQRTDDGWKYTLTYHDGVPVFVGTDPFTVARNLATAYRKALKDQRLVLEAQERNKKEVEKELFTRELFELLRNSDSLYDDAESQLRNDSSRTVPEGTVDPLGGKSALSEMFDYIERRDKPRRRQMRKVEGLARRLTKWISSDFFQAYAEAYRFDESDPSDENDSAEALIDLYAEILQDLDQSYAGYAFLRDWCGEAQSGTYSPQIINPDLGHFARAFIFRDEEEGVRSARIIRHSSKSIGRIGVEIAFAWVAELPEGYWEDVIEKEYAAHVKAKNGKTLRKLFWAKNGIFGVEFEREVKRHYVLRKRGSKPGLPDPYMRNYIAKDSPLGGKIKTWLDHQNSSGTDIHQIASEVTAQLGRFLDALNIAMAVRQVSDEVGRKGGSLFSKPTADLAIFTYSFLINELAPRFDEMKLGNFKFNIKMLGIVANIYFIHSNLNDIAVASASGNHKKIAALTVATGGEIISAMAVLGVFGGVSAFAGGVGFVIAAIGYVTASLVTKNPFEFFVARCEWGDERYSEFNPKHHRWIPHDAGSWRGNFKVQRQALFNLVNGFSARNSETFKDMVGPAVGIRMGHLPEQAVLQFNWRWRYTESSSVETDSWTETIRSLRKYAQVDGGVETYFTWPPDKVWTWMQQPENRWFGKNWGYPYDLWVQIVYWPFGKSPSKPRIPGKLDLAIQLCNDDDLVFETEQSVNVPH